MSRLVTPLTFTHTLADIVTADSRAAAVFDRFGLDYCCRGHQTIQEAAAAQDIPTGAILAELDALVESGDALEGPLDDADAEIVIDRIVHHHHAYIRDIGPVIEMWLAKMVARHGALHPEVREVQLVFHGLASELSAHMMKEESILFPFVQALAASAREGRELPPGPFGTVRNPIRMMEDDHREAGDLLARLRALTHDYTPPDDACTTYRLCYQELARFEADLHRHIHLENYVLFPRAIELERRLA